MFSAKFNELYFAKLTDLNQNYDANFVWLKEIIGETKKNFYAYDNFLRSILHFI